jgi:hypothetical protein
MSLPATSREQRKAAGLVHLIAEQLQRASRLARALPPDWRDGAALPPGALQDITRELAVPVRALSTRRRA